MHVERYDARDAREWDAFVSRSRNGTFLLTRPYMDYHADRFPDHSLVLRNGDGAIVAVCPATLKDDVLASHAGLTYGGFITDDTMKTPRMLELMEAVLGYCRGLGFGRMIYKTIPHIYHRAPAEEDRYALFLCNAAVTRRAVLTVVDQRARLPLQIRRARGLQKARRVPLDVRESDDYAAFWPILAARLREAHGVSPVHTLDEIRLLHGRFPANIRLFGAFDRSEMVAGVVVYASDFVAHVQYIATTPRGRDCGALDLIFSVLLDETFRATRFFDFGTADECDGRSLNLGLIEHKEGYGGRAIVHDHYQVAVDNVRPGQLTDALQ